MRKGIVFGLVVLLIGTSVVSSSNTNIVNNSQPMSRGWLYVGGNGTGNYSKIQDAIDNANDSDTIFVYNGTYYEHIIINKQITLTGEDKNTTIIDGTRSDSVIYIIKDNVTISAFTIQNGSLDDYGDTRAGIEIYSLNNSIIGNIITNNRVGIHPLWAGGLNFEGNNKIMDNIFIGNKRDALCIHCSFNIIKNNHIENNSGGVFLQINAFRNKIEQNNFINNGYNAEFYRGALTSWKNNFWDDWIGLKNPLFKIFPKAIIKYVVLYDFIPTPWMNFDWHPAKEPYDIG